MSMWFTNYGKQNKSLRGIKGLFQIESKCMLKNCIWAEGILMGYRLFWAWNTHLDPDGAEIKFRDELEAGMIKFTHVDFLEEIVGADLTSIKILSRKALHKRVFITWERQTKRSTRLGGRGGTYTLQIPGVHTLAEPDARKTQTH